jgi:excisionase family DNA binding protein
MPRARQFEAKNDEMISVREAAALLRLSEISIRRFLTQGRLRRFKAGSRTLLSRSDVLGMVKNN